ncbi:hypothetical protein BH11BAC2_BH11BAC2_07830 [soil metagenome]
MKKYFFIICFILGSLSLLHAQNNPETSFPLYKEVVEKFYNKYTIPEQFYPISIGFAKQIDGWHIQQIINDPEEKVQNDELFWNAMTKQFQPLNLSTALFKDSIAIKNQLANKWENEYYDEFPIYGFSNWGSELINYLKDKPNLSEWELYGLGRAYSNYAGNLINKNSGNHPLDYRFQLSEGPDAMSSEQLTLYRKYKHEAIRCFNALKKRNPNFYTVVGNIAVKQDNEHVSAYLDLATYQNEEEALKEIPDSLYSDFWIWVAKAYLNSCPENSILITNGDNDTYPLLYLQHKLNFRRDVKVINNSLLNTVPYLRSLQRKNNILNPFVVTLDSTNISQEKYSYLLIGDENDTLKLKEVFTHFDIDPRYSGLAQTGTDVRSIPSPRLFLQWNDSLDLYFKINRRYLLMSEIMTLNHLTFHAGKIPFCFASSVGKENFIGLEDYFNMNGMVHVLVPHRTASVNSFREIDNPDVFKSSMDALFNSACPAAIDYSEWGILTTVRSNFMFLAENYLNRDQKDSAIQVLNACEKNIPDSKCMYISPYYIDLYYRTGLIEDGNRIALLILHHIRSGEATKLFDQGKLSRSLLDVCEGIKMIVKNHQEETIISQVDEVIEELKSPSK